MLVNGWGWLVLLLARLVLLVKATALKFALITYCTCDNNGCELFRHSSLLKDEYCRRHGCEHLVYTQGPGMEKIDHNNRTAVAANVFWAAQYIIYDVLHQTVRVDGYEEYKYDWVFLTGGDMYMTDMSYGPLDIIPPIVRKEKGYEAWDMFIPEREKKSVTEKWGIMCAFLLRNTDFVRNFYEKVLQYSKKGYFVVDEQSAVNYLLLAHLRDVMNKAPDTLHLFEKDGNSSMYIPAPFKLYEKSNPHAYHQKLQAWGKANYEFLLDFYGPRPWSTSSPGRMSSRICLFETVGKKGLCHRGKLPVDECGRDVNEGHKFSFMNHQSGGQKYSGQGRVNFLRYTLGLATRFFGKDASKASSALVDRICNISYHP